MERKDFLDSLIGKNITEAIDVCIANDFKCRVIRENSINYIITADFSPDRVNLEIDKNFVTSAHNG